MPFFARGLSANGWLYKNVGCTHSGSIMLDINLSRMRGIVGGPDIATSALLATLMRAFKFSFDR